MKIIRFCLALLFVSFFFLPYTYTQTIIPGGSVSGEWTIDGSPYQVLDNIVILDDSTLVIEPGVLVEFQGHYAMHVGGRLIAEGTQPDTIKFTVNDTTGFFDPGSTQGGWYGIRIIDTPPDNDSTIFSYCKFQYGKAIGDSWHMNAGGALCIVNNHKVRISNCLIQHNKAGGSWDEVPSGGGVHLAWSNVKISGNHFIDNTARAGGAIQIHESDPLFLNNIFENNRAEDGGAISIGGLSSIAFVGDQFLNNEAEINGGGIMYWEPQDATFEDVVFMDNKAGWGAGLGLVNGNANIQNCTFENNVALWLGGGIATDFMEIEIIGSVFKNDSSGDLSGALHGYYTTAIIDETTFNQNASTFGGSIHADFSIFTITRSLFTNNSAEAGGCIHMWNSALTIDSVVFENNFATYESAVLDLLADTGNWTTPLPVVITHSEFLNNEASFRSGVGRIEQFNAGYSLFELLIDGCNFSYNEAERIGVFRIAGNIHGLQISNSLFSNNQSDLWTGSNTINTGASGVVFNNIFYNNVAGGGSAGALGISHGSHLLLLNNTFGANSGNIGGAVSLRRGASAEVVNSIFWGNEPHSISLSSLTDTTPCSLSMFYSDLQYGPDSVLVTDTISSVVWGEGNIDAQPLFQDILSGDFSLGENSPCIGAAIDSLEVSGTWILCPPADMMGNPRPDPAGSMPDMGALESPLGGNVFIGERNQGFKDPEWFKVYPNPFKDELCVWFELERPEWISLSMYHTDGSLIKCLTEGWYRQGEHTLCEVFKKIPGAIYLLIIETESKRKTIKIIRK